MDSCNEHDDFDAALIDAKKYPANLLRSQSFKYELVAYNETLRAQEARLFDDEPGYSGERLVESFDDCGKSGVHSDCFQTLLSSHEY